MVKTDASTTSNWNHEALKTENMYLFMEQRSFPSCDFQHWKGLKWEHQLTPEIEDPFTSIISSESGYNGE